MKDIKFDLDSEYDNFLMGKSVALVGPSKSIRGSGNGVLIDSHDVVVRLNKAIPIPRSLRNDIGRRTDVLYNCLKPGYTNGGDINTSSWIKHGVKYVCSPYPKLKFSKSDIIAFKKSNNGRINFRTFPLRAYRRLEAELKTRPNTGFLAIIDILSYSISSLYVTGITFGIDGYYKEYSSISMREYRRMANGPNHKQNPQFLFVKNKVFGKDKRFVPDATLKNILKNRVSV